MWCGLLTPEHGLRSRAAAGEKVASGMDPESGLPVISLYGDHRKPTPEDLEGLDALVFDLQGAGVRFYTYVSTMILAIEAAAEAGLEFVVLDRPNPLGGDRIEGPCQRASRCSSGELRQPGPGAAGARTDPGRDGPFVNQGLQKPAPLKVVIDEGLGTEHDLEGHPPHLGSAVSKSPQPRRRHRLSGGRAVGGHNGLRGPRN